MSSKVFKKIRYLSKIVGKKIGKKDFSIRHLPISTDFSSDLFLYDDVSDLTVSWSDSHPSSVSMTPICSILSVSRTNGNEVNLPRERLVTVFSRLFLVRLVMISLFSLISNLHKVSSCRISTEVSRPAPIPFRSSVVSRKVRMSDLFDAAINSLMVHRIDDFKRLVNLDH